MANPISELQNKFRFIDPQLTKEPFIFELLNEIELYQERMIAGKSHVLASVEDLLNSRNIKISFNEQRQKNILYLLDLLLKHHPDRVRSIISFVFSIDAPTKKLSIEEKKEYTVNLKEELYREIKNRRDAESLKSLLDLLGKFRLFNLTKLIKKTKHKEYLHDLINMETGKNIFIFKNFELDTNNTINTENYCFHLKNYDSVRKKLNPEGLRSIIKTHQDPINRRLKKFGILNSDFTDYRETKLDYILNIITEEIQSSLNKKEIVEVKNFESLRHCLREMEKVIDPAIQLNSDILQCIENTGICKESDLLSLFEDLTKESLDTWLKENIEKNKIFPHHEDESGTIYVDGKIFLKKMSDLYRLIFQDREAFTRLNSSEKRDYLSLMELLCRIGKELLKSETLSKAILENDGDIAEVRQIIENYEQATKKPTPEKEPEKERPVAQEREKKSLIRIIIDFFKSLFGGGVSGDTAGGGVIRDTGAASKKFSQETRNLYNEIKMINAPVIPLSDYLELIPKNEMTVEKIISELRGNNLKIIIPIYNARSALYPKRSQKLLISDVEYLMVDPNLTNDPDTIREFTDSLTGYKLKDEFMTPTAIMTIEKYLLTLYRQKRARALKKQ